MQPPAARSASTWLGALLPSTRRTLARRARATTVGSDTGMVHGPLTRRGAHAQALYEQGHGYIYGTYSGGEDYQVVTVLAMGEPHLGRAYVVVRFTNGLTKQCDASNVYLSTVPAPGESLDPLRDLLDQHRRA